MPPSLPRCCCSCSCCTSAVCSMYVGARRICCCSKIGHRRRQQQPSSCVFKSSRLLEAKNAQEIAANADAPTDVAHSGTYSLLHLLLLFVLSRTAVVFCLEQFFCFSLSGRQTHSTGWLVFFFSFSSSLTITVVKSVRKRESENPPRIVAL